MKIFQKKKTSKKNSEKVEKDEQDFDSVLQAFIKQNIADLGVMMDNA